MSPRSMTTGPMVVLISALLVAGPRPAAADPAPAAVQFGAEQTAAGAPELLFDQGRRLFEQFQYAEAVPIFDQIIAMLSVGGQVQKPELLVQALELRARARFALGEARAAEQDFSALLVVDPSFRLSPDVSPRVVSVLDAVRRLTVGQVVMSMEPGGEVQIDGKPYTVRPDPQPIDLAAGEHQLEVTLQGYRPVTERIAVVAGAAESLAIVLERVTATVTLTTVPDDVEVLLDGASRGRTERGSTGGASAPFMLTDLLPGSYTLQLRRPCYTDMDRTIAIARPEDLQMEPITLAPAVATVRVQSSAPSAAVFLDRAPRGTAPLQIDDLCHGEHTIEVRGERGRFIDHREWRAGDDVDLMADLRSAFPIVTTAGATPAAELRASVEQALAPAGHVLVYAPDEPDLDAALLGENVPPNWLARPSSVAEGQPPQAVPKQVVRDLGRRLAGKLGTQGVAAVSAGPDPYTVVVALLAAGSGEPDVITFNLGDPASRARAVDRLSAPLPPITRPSLESSIVDLAGTQGATVVRVGGAGARAGLSVGDTIVGAAGGPVASVVDLRTLLSNLSPLSLNLPLDVRGKDGTTTMVSGAIAMVPDTIPLNDPSLVYNRLLIEVEELAGTPADAVSTAAAQLNLAIVQMRLGNWEEAQQALQAAQLPDGPGVSAATVAYLRGLCFEALGRPADAREVFTRAAGSPDARLAADGPLVAPLARQKLER